MNIDEIISRRAELDMKLKSALSTRELKNTISEIKDEMAENQMRCPHISTRYNWSVIDGVCPYCGKKVGGE